MKSQERNPQALVVQRIEQPRPKGQIEVQFLSGAPLRKLQVSRARLASLGGQFVLDFRGKNELAILKEEKKIF